MAVKGALPMLHLVAGLEHAVQQGVNVGGARAWRVVQYAWEVFTNQASNAVLEILFEVAEQWVLVAEDVEFGQTDVRVTVPDFGLRAVGVCDLRQNVHGALEQLFFGRVRVDEDRGQLKVIQGAAALVHILELGDWLPQVVGVHIDQVVEKTEVPLRVDVLC